MSEAGWINSRQRYRLRSEVLVSEQPPAVLVGGTMHKAECYGRSTDTVVAVAAQPHDMSELSHVVLKDQCRFLQDGHDAEH